MAATTGPILAIGALTVFNDVVIGNKGLTDEFRVLAAVGIGVGVFAGLEKLNAQIAKGIVYIALVTAIVAPLAKDKTSFAERAAKWFDTSGLGTK